MADLLVPVIRELVKLIGKVKNTLSRFNTEWRDLEDVLKVLRPRIEMVKQFDEKSAEWSRDDENLGQVRRNEMNELMEKLKQCEQLIRECAEVSTWNIPLVSRYQKRLRDHHKRLRDFIDINMTADAWAIALTIINSNPILLGSAIPNPPQLTVGWKAPVEEVKQKLLQEDISVLGICGLGGCGKTTLATKFCEQVKGEFCTISFLPILRTPNLTEMVSRLWADLVSSVGPLPNFQNVDDAMNHLNSRLEKEKPEGKVLVVLDDVYHDQEEVEKLVIRKPGFKTLVTTREHLDWLQDSYKVPPLAMEEAKDLFYHHALVPDDAHFRRLTRQHVEQIVRGCMRNPLALKVVAASNKKPHAWALKHTATKIAEGGQFLSDYEQVLKRMETSVESLSEKQRECFADFSCFSGNKRIRATTVMDMWVQIRGETELGARKILQDLFDRHLIELFERRRNHGGDPDEGFGDLYATQHDLLTELAVRTSQQTNKTRLVISERDELPNVDLASEAQIVTIDMGDGRRKFDMYTPRPFPRAEVLILNFSGSACSLPPFVWEMESLKLLIVSNHSSTAAELRGLPPSCFLKNLESVRLEKILFPILHTFAEPFPKLQKLSLVKCKVREEESSSLLDIPKIFPELTEIEIDYCDGLERLPTSVCDIPNLKKLSITNCPDLMELPEAIGRLSKLEVLRLRACTALESLPDSISELKQLKFLDLSECLNISRLPEAIGGLRGLEKIDVRGYSASLPQTVRQLKGLKLVKCDPDTAPLWEPYQVHINELEVVIIEAHVSLDFLQ